MSRSSAHWLLALTLVTGMLIGVLIDRRGPSLSAQSSTTAQPASSPLSSSTDPSPSVRTSSDDAIYQQLNRQYALFEPVNRTFELVARAVSPSVVHIVAQKTGRIDESVRVRHYEETGSGVIVRADRSKGLYVITNNHVVEGSPASRINVFLHDGRAIRPDQVWLDAKADIAVLGLNRDDLPAARFGNSDESAVGNWVLAMGSPFGLTHSVSQGIISARGRHVDELPDVENQDFLQTDAAINPGNSGGPLVNMKGEVIGINNSIASHGGGNEGVGFSIPINLARWIMNQLLAKGRVTRGALGIDLHPEFRPDDASKLGLDRPRGAWIDVVRPASPASAAGLKDGDVVLVFKGIDVSDLNHLINMVSMAQIGEQADLVVWRDRQKMALRVTVGDRERSFSQASPVVERSANPRGAPLRRPERPATTGGYALGIELQTIDEATARRFALPASSRGAVVVEVVTGSPLAGSLQAMDVITSINGRAILTAEEAVKLMNGRAESDAILLGYERIVKGAIERRTVRVP